MKNEFQAVGKDYVEQKKNQNGEPAESCCDAWSRYTIEKEHTPIFCHTCQQDMVNIEEKS